MALAIDVNVVNAGWPPEDALHELARRATDAVIAQLSLEIPDGCELSLLFTDDAGISRLNGQWRGKDKPTNVLSFPAFPIRRGNALPPMLGDIVLARETVEGEAIAESKPLANHLNHLVIHGFLHLIGYDHETDAEAEEMEEVERQVLAALAIPDPYA